MFTAILDDISLLEDCVATISELIDEAEFKVRKDGIHLLAADRAVVAVVDFYFSSENFREYNYESDATIGISLQPFLKVLKRARKDDVLIMQLEESYLTLVLKGVSTRRFKLPLIEIHSEVPPGIEKLNFPASVDIRSDVLQDCVRDAELVADSLVFELSPEKLVIKAEGDSSVVEAELTKDSDAVRINTGKEARARYSIEYLKKMLKASKSADIATLAFDTNYPMKLTFAMQDRVKLSFILAPRVED